MALRKERLLFDKILHFIHRAANTVSKYALYTFSSQDDYIKALNFIEDKEWNNPDTVAEGWALEVNIDYVWHFELFLHDNGIIPLSTEVEEELT